MPAPPLVSCRLYAYARVVRLAQKYWETVAPPGQFAVQPADPESSEAEPAAPIFTVMIEPMASDALA